MSEEVVGAGNHKCIIFIPGSRVCHIGDSEQSHEVGDSKLSTFSDGKK